MGNTRISAAASQCLADGGCDFALIETACPNGCAAGACVGQPCLGMACIQPPKAKCESATALRVFTSPGACQAGGCLYASAEVSCDCENDHCKSNPCIGVVCNQPPGATCVAAALRTWQSPGACVEVSVGCNASNCAGCCNGNACVLVAAQGNAQCGSAGTACGSCGSCGSSAPVCEQGACISKCAGVSCNQLPATTCLDATTKTQWSGGSCNPSTGACSYTSANVTCGTGNS